LNNARRPVVKTSYATRSDRRAKDGESAVREHGETGSRIEDGVVDAGGHRHHRRHLLQPDASMRAVAINGDGIVDRQRNVRGARREPEQPSLELIMGQAGLVCFHRTVFRGGDSQDFPRESSKRVTPALVGLTRFHVNKKKSNDARSFTTLIDMLFVERRTVVALASRVACRRRTRLCSYDGQLIDEGDRWRAIGARSNSSFYFKKFVVVQRAFVVGESKPGRAIGASVRARWKPDRLD
jgi:hypothetical protein